MFDRRSDKVNLLRGSDRLHFRAVVSMSSEPITILREEVLLTDAECRIGFSEF